MTRTDRILFDSLDTKTDRLQAHSELIEIDTSCPFVPFGQVSLGTLALSKSDAPDRFWSWSLSRDGLLEYGAGRIAGLEPRYLPGIFEAIRSDITRANGSLELPSLDSITESFTLEDGCKYCFGTVLLLRSPGCAYYLHWHRES